MVGATFPSQIKFHSYRKHLLHLQTLRLLATAVCCISEVLQDISPQLIQKEGFRKWSKRGQKSVDYSIGVDNPIILRNSSVLEQSYKPFLVFVLPKNVGNVFENDKEKSFKSWDLDSQEQLKIMQVRRRWWLLLYIHSSRIIRQPSSFIQSRVWNPCLPFCRNISQMVRWSGCCRQISALKISGKELNAHFPCLHSALTTGQRTQKCQDYFFLFLILPNVIDCESCLLTSFESFLSLMQFLPAVPMVQIWQEVVAFTRTDVYIRAEIQHTPACALTLSLLLSLLQLKSRQFLHGHVKVLRDIWMTMQS